MVDLPSVERDSGNKTSRKRSSFLCNQEDRYLKMSEEKASVPWFFSSVLMPSLKSRGSERLRPLVGRFVYRWNLIPQRMQILKSALKRFR